MTGMTKRILFLSKGESSASTRYRAMQYFPLLQRAGFDVAHAAVSGGIFNYLYALRSAAAADIVVILRKTFPAPMLCNSDGSPSATRMRRFTAMAGTCDHILAGNGFLAGTAARFNPAVTVIPTSVDTSQYAAESPKPDDSIDLVWIGSRSTRKYLLEVLPALRLASVGHC